MAATIGKIKKLRGRGFAEIRERSRQELSKLTERLLGTPREMSDRAFKRAIGAADKNHPVPHASPITERALTATATSFRSAAVATPDASKVAEARTGLFPSPLEHDTIAALMDARFPAERDAIIERARRAIKGQFDLLGYSALSFGSPIDWHLEPVSGKRTGLQHWSTIDYLDPSIAGDKKITWELNRHSHFVTFGQAYWLTRDEQFARAFIEQASSWIEANPLRRGINWSSSLEVSLRAISWLWALHLMIDAEAVTSSFVARLLKSLIAHGRHISSYLSNYFSPNTHLTGEALGLMYLSAALPSLSYARQWRLKGLAILLEQLPIHLKSDGVYFEQSSYYHRYTTDFCLHLKLIARATRLELGSDFDHLLSLALDHLMWMTRPEGTTPLVGDDDGGCLLKLAARRSDDFRDTLALGATLFERGDWKHASGSASELLWLVGEAALNSYDEIEGAAPPAFTRAFNDTGYFIARDGWTSRDSFVLVHCGPNGLPGSAHSHADSLNLEFSARGISWVVDPGTFTYTGDAKARDWFRSSLAHSTASVDGEGQSETGGPFAWTSTANSTPHEFIGEQAFAYFEGSHDGYQRLSDPVTHTRSILYIKNDPRSSLSAYVIVRDWFDGKMPHRYSTRFQLGPEASAKSWANTVVANTEKGEKLCLSIWSSNRSDTGSLAGTAVSVEKSWVSQVYGQRRRAPAVVATSEGAGAHQIVSILTPQSRNSGLPSVSQARGVYSISTGDSFDLIACPENQDARSSLLNASCQMSWVRFERGRLSRGCMIRGSRIAVSDGISIESSGMVPWLSFNINGDALDIRTGAAERLEISVPGSLRLLNVNGTLFDLQAASSRVVLVQTEAGWRLATRS